MVIPVPNPGPTPSSTFTGRAPIVQIVPMVDGPPIPITGDGGAPLEVTGPAGAPVEVATPAGAPLEVYGPAGAPVEVASSDHMNALATLQGCGYPFVHMESLPMDVNQTGWSDMGDTGYFDPPVSPPAAWCPVCVTLRNPQTCGYMFDFHVTINDLTNNRIISEFFNYFTVLPGNSVLKFFNVPQFVNTAETGVTYMLRWIPLAAPGPSTYFSVAIFATLRPSND